MATNTSSSDGSWVDRLCTAKPSTSNESSTCRMARPSATARCTENVPRSFGGVTRSKRTPGARLSASVGVPGSSSMTTRRSADTRSRRPRGVSVARIFPWSMIAMRSHNSSASAM